MENIFKTEPFSIKKIVDEKYHFIIPSYQRPYVWGELEIVKLIEDVFNFFQNKQKNEFYFVGNTYVINKTQGLFEIIDGQQRFTTFWLLAFVCKKLGIDSDITHFIEFEKDKKTAIRLDFDIRVEVHDYLVGLYTNTETSLSAKNDDKPFLIHIERAIKIIENEFNKPEYRENLKELADYLYNNVIFIFNEAPQNTDLNSLFTALGNSGVQLQQSDILKSRILSQLNPEDRLKFGKIWECCEDMNQYFEKNVSEVFEFDRTNLKIDSFSEFNDEIFTLKNSTDNNSELKSESGVTIQQIIESNEQLNDNEVSKKESDDTEQKAESIISFNLFLIHCYRIYLKLNYKEDLTHYIQPENLLDTIKIENLDAEEFIKLMWQLRYIFDKEVVKWRFAEEAFGNDQKILLLTKVRETTDKNKTYFSREDQAYSELQMLQSVLYFTGGYKTQYWLTPFLYHLLINQEIDSLQLLESIDNYMTPGSGLEKSKELLMDYQNKELNLNFDEILSNPKNGSFHYPHYWFYKLEYILWKEFENREDPKFKNYRITAKNSIEHVLAQNEEFGNKLDIEHLHSFGNLALLSVGQNSSYSNQGILKKRVDFNSKPTYDSLKLELIYDSFDENDLWNEEKIRIHKKDMIDKLNKHYGITN